MVKDPALVLSEPDNYSFTLITESDTEDANDPCQIVGSDDDVEDDINTGEWLFWLLKTEYRKPRETTFDVYVW